MYVDCDLITRANKRKRTTHCGLGRDMQDDSSIGRSAHPSVRDPHHVGQLFVGSEGLLGVITELTLRLVPIPPPASTLVAVFDSVEAAADAVLAITASVRPSMLELMDRTAINAVEDMLAMGLDCTARALLLARSDASGPAAAYEIEAMAKFCRAEGASEVFSTDDAEEGEAFAAARRAALPAMERLGALLLEDIGVAVAALPALLRGVEQIADRYELTIAVVAHAGDGNAHPMLVHDSADPDAVRRPASPSPRSWISRSTLVAQSPVSTASVASRRNGCRPISATMS